jgi:cytochrome P450
VKAGEKVVMFYNSGNRDERVFDNPYAFDVTREPNPPRSASAPADRTSASAPTWPAARSR